jgi:hypothetical protein
MTFINPERVHVAPHGPAMAGDTDIGAMNHTGVSTQ